MLRLRLAGDHTLSARASSAPNVRIGQKILAMLRPENVRIAPPGAAISDTTILQGAVSDVEYLGEDTQIRVQIKGLKPLLASFKTTREASARAAAGTVHVHIEPDDVFLLSR